MGRWAHSDGGNLMAATRSKRLHATPLHHHRSTFIFANISYKETNCREQRQHDRSGPSSHTILQTRAHASPQQNSPVHFSRARDIFCTTTRKVHTRTIFVINYGYTRERLCARLMRFVHTRKHAATTTTTTRMALCDYRTRKMCVLRGAWRISGRI